MSSSLAKREAELLRKHEALEKKKRNVVKEADQALQSMNLTIPPSGNTFPTSKSPGSRGSRRRATKAAFNKSSLPSQGHFGMGSTSSSPRSRRMRGNKTGSPKTMKKLPNVLDENQHSVKTKKKVEKSPKESEPKQEPQKPLLPSQIDAAMGNMQGGHWASDPVVCDEMGVEAVMRMQKAQVKSLKVELDAVNVQKRQAREELKQAENKLGVLAEENRKLTKSLQNSAVSLEQEKKIIRDLKEKAKDDHQKMISLEKTIQTQKREFKKRETESSTKDVRLHRALEEVDRLKNVIKDLRSSAKEDTGMAKEKETDLINHIKVLENQKKELIAAFRKQLKLIDILKRQKVHLEAAKMLSFTEEEFSRTLETAL
eukprot:g4199.t1